MKTFRSISAATRAAAEIGATLDVGGRTINAAGARMSVVRSTPAEQLEPAPAPPAAPAVPDGPSVIDLVSQVALAQASAMGEVLQRIVERLPPPAAPAAPPAPRRMPTAINVIRARDGRVESLSVEWGEVAAGAALKSLNPVVDGDGLMTRIEPAY